MSGNFTFIFLFQILFSDNLLFIKLEIEITLSTLTSVPSKENKKVHNIKKEALPNV